MNRKTLEELKPIAEEYAYLIIEERNDRDRIQVLRRELGFVKDKSAVSSMHENNTVSRNDNIVGIWREQRVNGNKVFVRDERFSLEFQNWAKVNEIPEKSDKFRIAFIGESVARGFLYDPFIMPASILEDTLKYNLENYEVEVIDLACVSIKIEELKKLCFQSILLEPDALVIFAGNNWRKSLWDLSEYEINELIAAMDKSDRFQRLKNIIEDKSAKMIASFMQALNEISETYRIPVTIIIPEFNLKDWKSNTTERILCWPNGKTREWKSLQSKTEAALSRSDLTETEKNALEMIELNRANPLGYELLGDIKLSQDMYEEARRYFESALDTRIFRLGPPPAITSFIHRELLEKAHQYKFRVVDLPEIFKAHLSGCIPGNELFIDYCHLSAEGIQLAMKHTAQSLLPIIYDKKIAAESVKMKDYKFNDEVIGKAHFFAAIHSAHMGDMPYELLLYHCRKAANSCNKVRDLLIKYIDVATRKIPWALNKSYEAIFDKQYPILRQFGDCKIMDIKLVNAMIDALKTVGIDIKKDVDSLRIEEHKPTTNKKINLLDTYYRESSYFNTFTASKSIDYENRKQSYVSSRDTKSIFYLIADKNKDLVVNLTFRTPIIEDDLQKIKISVNDTAIMDEKASEIWKDCSFSISNIILKEDGVNTIEIQWPFMDKAEERIKKEYEKKYSGLDLIINRSRPTYGEIIRFNAYAATQH